MKENCRKTIIFLNLRFSDFYSKELFKNLKEDKQVRILVILDQQFQDRVGEHIAPYIDETHIIPSNPKMGFLAEFDYAKLRAIVEKEVDKAKEVKIVCSDEFNLLNAGRLRVEFGLTGLLDNELVVFRDKLKMKQMLQQAGIRVPKFKRLNSVDNFNLLEKEIGLPFVIKPADSCGSHGVYMIRNQNDFKQFEQEVKNFEEFEVEEFIEGKLYHVDSLIKNKKITFICANEYTCPNHEYTKGRVLASLPLDNENQISIRLINFAKKCLSVLGANNIVNHMELFITQEDEIVFLEVSGRPPGAFLNLTHQFNFGINLMDEDFFLQTGMVVSMNKIETKEKAFFALFPLIPGEIVNLVSPKVKSRIEMTWNVVKGTVVKQEMCKNIVEKSAHAILYNSDYEILRNDFEIIKKHKAIEVV